MWVRECGKQAYLGGHASEEAAAETHDGRCAGFSDSLSIVTCRLSMSSVSLLCRWEAHVWVRESGKQAYLGGYASEEEAAEAHDVAAIKCHGLKAKTNFHISR